MPWEQIAACDIVTEHNVFGKVESRNLVVKNAAGKHLLKFKAEPQVEEYIAIELMGYRREPAAQLTEPLV